MLTTASFTQSSTNPLTKSNHLSKFWQPYHSSHLTKTPIPKVSGNCRDCGKREACFLCLHPGFLQKAARHCFRLLKKQNTKPHNTSFPPNFSLIHREFGRREEMSFFSAFWADREDRTRCIAFCKSTVQMQRKTSFIGQVFCTCYTDWGSGLQITLAYAHFCCVNFRTILGYIQGVESKKWHILPIWL